MEASEITQCVASLLPTKFLAKKYVLGPRRQQNFIVVTNTSEIVLDYKYLPTAILLAGPC